MGDKLLLIPYFDNFDFQCSLFSKNAPKFWHSIQLNKYETAPNFIQLSQNLTSADQNKTILWSGHAGTGTKQGNSAKSTNNLISSFGLIK